MSDPPSEPAFGADLLRHAHVDVRPVGARRWAWVLVDERDGSIVETELPFDTASAARRSGLSRLEELVASLAHVAAAAPHLAIVVCGWWIAASRRTPGAGWRQERRSA
jgi:hypothetical protein